jgi:hypothetical protein
MRGLSVLLRESRGKPIEEVAAMVPKDEDGNSTSIGSLLHACGQCKVCVDWRPGDPESCRKGLRCRFCHFDHTLEQRTKRKLTHVKEKLTLRRFASSVRRAIQADPEHFCVEEIRLPPSVEALVSQEAFVEEMRLFRLQLMSGREGSASCAADPGEARCSGDPNLR